MQKNKVKEELNQMKSMISQEFDRIYYLQSQHGASTTLRNVKKPTGFNHRSSKYMGQAIERSSMSSFTPYLAESGGINRSVSNNMVSIDVQRLQSALSRISSPSNKVMGQRNDNKANNHWTFTPARTPSRCGSRGGRP
jgi:hypothetical protein